LIVIAVEGKDGRLGRTRLRRVTDVSASSLSDAVQESVTSGSLLVRTDGWRGYAGLASKSYEHTVIRQDADVGDNLLPLANRVAALLKRWLQGTHQGVVRMSHLDYYRDELIFRFNRGTSRSRGKLLYRLVQQAVLVEPVTGEDLQLETRVIAQDMAAAGAKRIAQFGYMRLVDDKDGKDRREAFYAFRLMASKLDGFKKVEITDVGSGKEGFKFTKDAGEIYVLWSEKGAEVPLPVEEGEALVTDVFGYQTAMMA